MFFLCIFGETKFNDKGVFAMNHRKNIVVVEASGSSYQTINGTNQKTKPEYAIMPVDKTYDWCSNCGRSYEDFPWISFSLKQKKISFSGYFLRAGCCYGTRCCCENQGYCVRCCLYSWKLQISDDNKTWTDVHSVEKDWKMEYCSEKTYNLEKTYIAKFVRLIQTENCPGDPPCLAINRIELLGGTIDDSNESDDFTSFHDDDEDVSIIGHISKS